MSEPTITCPHCGREIKLTESLAAPLVAATKREYEARLASHDAEMGKREQTLKLREENLSRQKETLDAEVAEKLRRERARIAEDEARKAKLALATDLEQRDKENAELKAVVSQRDAKLAEAQKQQAELLRKQRELEDQKRELDLTIEKRLNEAQEGIRAQARKEADERFHLQVAEREQTIKSMKATIEDLQRKAEQGSQQLQGEVLELELEELLRRQFPMDGIAPVPKGEHGGDVIHQVMGAMGQACGSMLWELKRTKNWSDGWLAKLRADQRAAKAEIAIIVSQVLPKEVETFSLVDGVWVTQPRLAAPVAMALRQALIEVAAARKSVEGQQGKMEMVYQYLTGARFSQRVQAIVEAFTSMQDDLAAEKKAITRQWAKREQQIGIVMQATVGLYGDLQGIAGKSLKEIEGLEMKALGAGEGDEG